MFHDCGRCSMSSRRSQLIAVWSKKWQRADSLDPRRKDDVDDAYEAAEKDRLKRDDVSRNDVNRSDVGRDELHRDDVNGALHRGSSSLGCACNSSKSRRSSPTSSIGARRT